MLVRIAKLSTCTASLLLQQSRPNRCVCLCVRRKEFLLCAVCSLLWYDSCGGKKKSILGVLLTDVCYVHYYDKLACFGLISLRMCQINTRENVSSCTNVLHIVHLVCCFVKAIIVSQTNTCSCLIQVFRVFTETWSPRHYFHPCGSSLAECGEETREDQTGYIGSLLVFNGVLI